MRWRHLRIAIYGRPGRLEGLVSQASRILRCDNEARKVSWMVDRLHRLLARPLTYARELAATVGQASMQRDAAAFTETPERICSKTRTSVIVKSVRRCNLAILAIGIKYICSWLFESRSCIPLTGKLDYCMSARWPLRSCGLYWRSTWNSRLKSFQARVLH